MRLVVKLIFANLAGSVLVCALIVAFRHDVLAYQFARQPAIDHAAIEMILWTRPIRILVVLGIDLWLVRGLQHGNPRAYRRIRWASTAGVLLLGWLIIQGGVPVWLTAVQAGQLVLLAALAGAVNRPLLRAAFIQPEHEVLAR